MATSSFDKMFVITDPEAVKRIEKILTSEDKAPECKFPPYTQEDRDRSEALLKRFFSRSDN